ncbi:exonuclease [Mycobacterium phage Funsized]|nr:exonuclease [Mycobacterium phage Funsized]
MARRKSNVAAAFPARQQPDGRVYRRSGPGDQDGWSDNPAFAHPDYFAPGAPAPLPPTDASSPTVVSVPPDTVNDAQNATQADSTTTTEETPMTALNDDFTEAGRTTEYQGYPLPPPTPRVASVFGKWGWYKLPDPDTGRPAIYPRATTIAKVLEDREGLAKWGRRETALRVAQLAKMEPDERLNPLFETTASSALSALIAATEADKVTAIDAVLDMIDNLMGGAHARELGECVHAWLEALDMGIVLMRDVPALVRPHVDAYYRVMSHRGLVALPDYVERTVLNTQCADEDMPVAGKIDRVFRIVTTGELVLGDVKTSKDLQYSWLSFAVQVGGVYGWAERVLTLDATGWEPMPEIREDFAILMHVPSNNPAGTAAITIDKWFGGEALVETAAVRNRRKIAPSAVPKHAVPIPSDTAIRYATARHALSCITSLDEGQAVYQSFEDVWDDALDEHATRVAALLDQ